MNAYTRGEEETTSSTMSISCQCRLLRFVILCYGKTTSERNVRDFMHDADTMHEKKRSTLRCTDLAMLLMRVLTANGLILYNKIYNIVRRQFGNFIFCVPNLPLSIQSTKLTWTIL